MSFEASYSCRWPGGALRLTVSDALAHHHLEAADRIGHGYECAHMTEKAIDVNRRGGLAQLTQLM
jgi:hypothetical protein